MTERDTLEVLREVSRMMAARPDDIIEEPRGWVHCREEMQPMLDAAIAAWEKERADHEAMRAEFQTLAKGDLAQARRLVALRAEVLAVAEEMEQLSFQPGEYANETVKAWKRCVAGIAARLRKACE